jgi:eukaryotic-like serine/threonine-protein kinase
MTAGARLGPYELIAGIGAGGMGEVWRARDTRLDRDVAIKISREEFNDRFQREARAVAALNHPNVCHLYDVGPNYLVMELIDGETLAERIARGAVPVAEALAMARQIADALEAAHEKGIVHRDLKPANIKLTAEGAVKVLDFGLARLAPLESADPHDSPTTLAPPTRVGTILGTAAYMAPEQARGKTADKRADIWAFGVVLYELLTGKQLFGGETISDTLAGVLKNEPDFSAIPVKVRPLVARCLEKDPKQRLRDIGDYELLLHAQSADQPAPRRKSGASAWMAAVCVALAAALSFAAWLWFRPAPLPQVTRFQIYAPPGSTLPLGVPAPSPDGRMLAYTVSGQDGVTRIHLRSMESGESHALAGTEYAIRPFWSPDGLSLAFAASGELKRIEVAGGSARNLTTTEAPWHGAWGKSGLILFQPNAIAWKVPADGGASAPAMTLDQTKGETGGGFPFFLSDGKRFLLSMLHGDGDGSIDLASVGTMERRVVLPGISSAPVLAPAPNGRNYLLYLRDSSLMAQEFDENTGAVRGNSFLLVDGIARVAARSTRPSVGVSSNGVLAFQTGGDTEAYRLTWFDRSGKDIRNIRSPDGGFAPRLSPDGRFVAVRKRSDHGSDIWLEDLDRGSSTRFTFGSAGKNYADPIWSPDGKRLAFTLVGAGIYVKDVNGTGKEQELMKGDGISSLSWSPDGRQILIWDFGKLSVLRPDRGRIPIDAAPAFVMSSDGGAEISPDGRYFAFSSRESGRGEVYVAALPPATGKWQISLDSGAQPRWRKDGKELFFVSRDRKVMAVDIQTGLGVTVGVPHTLFETKINAPYWDVSADGQRFLLATATALTADSPITVVLNWWAGIRK